MKTSALVRIAFVNAVGFSGSTVMPLWLAGLAAYFAMPAWFAGAAVVALLGGAALFNLGTPLIFRRVALLPLARIALLVATAAYLLAATHSPALFLLASLITGCALGTVLNVTNRLMGSNDHVQKGYAIFLLIEVCFATVMFLSCAALIARFGLSAMFPLVAVATLIAFLLLHSIDVGQAVPVTVEERVGPAHRMWGVLTLAAFGLFFIGQATLNSFMPAIGQAAGLSAERASQVIGLGMPFGFAGAMLARVVGERIRPIVPVALVVIILGCLAPVVTLAPSFPLFVATVVLMMSCTMFSVPYFFAQLGAFDRHGRYTAFGPAMMLAGIAAGPSAAVVLSAQEGLPAVGAFSALFLLLGGGLFAVATLARGGAVALPGRA